MKRKLVVYLFLAFLVMALAGCGGGGGGDASPTAPIVTTNPLASALVGTWILDQEDDVSGNFHPVLPNGSGGISTVTFSGDGTGSSVSYDRVYTTTEGLARCKDMVPVTGAFTWTLSGSALITVSSWGTHTNSVSISNNNLHQTLSDGSRAVWKR